MHNNKLVILKVMNIEQVCENLQENHLPVQNTGSQRTLENFHQTVVELIGCSADT